MRARSTSPGRWTSFRGRRRSRSIATAAPSSSTGARSSPCGPARPTARSAADLLVALLSGPFPDRDAPVEVGAGAPARQLRAADHRGRRSRPRARRLCPGGDADRVTVRATAPAGFAYGVQTLRQLLPPEIEAGAPPDGVVWSVPSVRIRDVPRFGWRGLLIDTSRFFIPKPLLLRELELMALYKLSVLHLHLTDDQGWRLEIDAYPSLHELGSQWDAERAPDRAERVLYESRHPRDRRARQRPRHRGVARDRHAGPHRRGAARAAGARLPDGARRSAHAPTSFRSCRC